jgi:hypothetical protein
VLHLLIDIALGFTASLVITIAGLAGRDLIRKLFRSPPRGTRLLAVGDPLFPPTKRATPPAALPPGGLLIVQVVPGGNVAKARSVCLSLWQAENPLPAYAEWQRHHPGGPWAKSDGEANVVWLDDGQWLGGLQHRYCRCAGSATANADARSIGMNLDHIPDLPQAQAHRAAARQQERLREAQEAVAAALPAQAAVAGRQRHQLGVQLPIFQHLCRRSTASQSCFITEKVKVIATWLSCCVWRNAPSAAGCFEGGRSWLGG